MQSPSTNSSFEKASEKECYDENVGGSVRRILFIDDDEAIVDGYKFIFECEDFKVDVALDALKALELIKANSYSAIVMDYNLPGMKGDDLAEQIQANDNSSCLILISGQKDIEKELDRKNIKVAGVFLKPLKVETLIDFVLERISR